MFDENGKYIEENNESENNGTESVEKAEEPVLEEVEESVTVEPAFTNDFDMEYTEKKKPEKKGVLKSVVATALCACVAGVVFASAFNMTNGAISVYKATIGTTQDNLKASEATDVVGLSYSDLTDKNAKLDVEDIAEACLPSVVSITNKGVSEVMTFFGNYQTESISSGSGIIIGENETELLIVTNYHVVADSKELTVVFFHEEELSADEEASYVKIAKVKGYDEAKDIAVIAVDLDDITEENRKEIKIATIGNSNDVKLGSGVVAIGNSLGYGQSVTHGIVSALNRELVSNNHEDANSYIQTDAAINAGNSGGALLNMKGELIGINTAKIASTGVEGMGYAIPISDVEELIGNLMSLKTRDVVDEEKRGYLGIYGIDVTSQISQMYGMPVGIFVQSTTEGSPAESSGLQEGDIIVKIDDVAVSNMTSLQERLSYYEAGETITLKVKRQNGRRYDDVSIEVTLSSKKDAGIEE